MRYDDAHSARFSERIDATFRSFICTCATRVSMTHTRRFSTQTIPQLYRNYTVMKIKKNRACLIIKFQLHNETSFATVRDERTSKRVRENVYVLSIDCFLSFFSFFFLFARKNVRNARDFYNSSLGGSDTDCFCCGTLTHTHTHNSVKRGRKREPSKNMRTHTRTHRSYIYGFARAGQIDFVCTSASHATCMPRSHVPVNIGTLCRNAAGSVDELRICQRDEQGLAFAEIAAANIRFEERPDFVKFLLAFYSFNYISFV